MTSEPAPASALATPAHPAAGTWLCLSTWVVVAGIAMVVACVPSYRGPWSETLPVVRADNGLLVSATLTPFATPYISFARVRFAERPDVNEVSIVLVSGHEPVSSLQDVNRRRLLTVRAGPIPTSSGLEYEAMLAAASQFRPSGAIRVVVLASSGSETLPRPSDRVAHVRIGYDGRSPAVSAIRYWWPWFAGVFLVVSLVLLSPLSRSFQQRIQIGAREAIRTHRSLLGIALASVILRFALVWRGGQYFDWDELRYGTGATRLFELLSTGNFSAALRVLLDSPDHPGFRIIGVLPAFFHVVSAWWTRHPVSDVLNPAGEWLAAFLLSLAAVWSIGLTYLLALRVGASLREGVLAAFLMSASASMLIYARHFFPLTPQWR